MKIFSLVNLFILLFLFVSCQKQKAPSLDTLESGRAQDMERLKACSEIDFNHNILLYQNTLLLFKCTRWDLDFPYMYQAIKDMRSDSWDQLMGPINESFMENKERKNKFFSSIHELDSKGGLEDLSYVLVALNESNFFDAIRSMFLCMDNIQAPECKDRQDQIPSRKSIKQILHVLDIPADVMEENIQVLRNINNSMGPYQEKLRIEINKFKSVPLAQSYKIKLIDELAKKINSGLTDTDRKFISNILMTQELNKNKPWLFEWIQDEKLGREKFRDLLEYPSLTNPTLISEIRGLKDAYNLNFSCSIPKDNSANELIQFDLKTHMSDYVTVIKDRNYKSFYDFSSADIVGLKLSTTICRELEQNQYNVNFIKLLSEVSDFLKEKKNYDLLKFLVTTTEIPFDINNNFTQNLYLFDLIAGNIFLNSNNMGQEILKTTRDFYPLVFDVVKTLPEETYYAAGEVAHEVFKSEYDKIFKGTADYWLFLRPSEKNFLFNFIDKHFDNNIKYIMLLDFYIKQFDDYREIQPIFQNAWTETEKKEELTTLSIQDFVTHMSGKNALNDFKKFFSRNQIIKVLEVLSSGQQISQQAKDELAYRDSTQYVIKSRTNRYKITIPYDPGKDVDYDASGVVNCMKKFTAENTNFYDMIKNFPSACQKIANENISFKLFGWMNNLEESYLQFKKPENINNSLLDREGLMGPFMLNTEIGLLKIIDSIVGPYNVAVKKNGVDYLFRSANYHLNSKGAAILIEKNLDILNQIQELKPEENVVFRNSLLKKFTNESNFLSSRFIFQRLGQNLQSYGNWIKAGEWQKAQQRSLGTYNPNSDCSKVINQHISPSPCPSKDEIKKYGNSILNILSNVWEKEEGSPIGLLILAQKEGEGLNIPLDSAKPKKYRMSISESLKYLYDTSDRTLDINKKVVKYTNEKGIIFNEPVTTLERIETVIREVRFNNNYLGVSYLNHVVGGNDYNKDVQERKFILSKCVKIPIERCGRRMSDSDIRMTNNALASYDALLDANNGRGLEKKFQFGDYLKTLQQTFVGSSSKAAQEITFFPLSDAVLAKHNGKALGDLTLLTAFSNSARVLRDRVGRTREEFNIFINRPDFKRVDRTFLHGFEVKETSASAERLIKKIKDKQLFDEAVDWIATLDYNQVRLLEDTVARLMVLTSYLGSPDIVFEKNDIQNIDPRYKDNNISQMFLALEKIIDYWPTIKSSFPADAKLIDFIKPINTGLFYLTEKLNSTTDPEKNLTYQSLNDLFMIMQATIFDEQADSRILGNLNKTNKGLDFMLALFSSPEKTKNTFNILRENYHYLDIFHQLDSEWFESTGQNIERLSRDSRVDFTPIRDYVSYTSKNFMCLMDEKACEANYHYDEIANFNKYLIQKDEHGESNFMLTNKKIMLENIDQIIQMINDVIPAIKIKDLKQPQSF